MHSSGTNMPCPANGGYPSQPISFCGIFCQSRKTDSAGSSKASSPLCPHCLAPPDSSLFGNACSYYSFSQLFMFLYPITGHWKNEWLNLIIFVDLFYRPRTLLRYKFNLTGHSYCIPLCRIIPLYQIKKTIKRSFFSLQPRHLCGTLYFVFLSCCLPDDRSYDAARSFFSVFAM